MTEETSQEEATMQQQDYDACKIYISRIPITFDEAAVQRLLVEKLGGNKDAVTNIALIYPHDDEQEDDESKQKQEEKETLKRNHRGFGFATLDSKERVEQALKLGTIRGGFKSTSTKKHTLYLRPIVRHDTELSQESPQQQECFLWSKSRCPYGDDCKFAHVGPGGCLPKMSSSERKRKKCFNYKKGKCKLGDACPFSHDFEVSTKPKPRSKSEKDCISWKSKGKCSKGDACPYRHDEKVAKKALAKKKKRQGDKERQPLSIRVFGLCYDTQESDVRDFFSDCGTIMEITFPTFEDSGRSKGYCGILFQSPKAVAKAVELDGKELHGRWLRVQAGKMYLKQWEEQHEERKREKNEGESTQVGEFGQKVKKRKQHGFKD